MLKNTTALAVGRNVNALARLVAAGMIVRGFGAGTFGEYALIIALLTIADWVLDFGTTDVFVRESNRAPERRAHLRRILIAVKLLQIPVAVLVFVAMLLVMQYPARIVLAGLVGGAGLVLFAGVVAYRAMFKATLTMGREVASEFVSVLVMLPLIWLVLHRGGGLIGLMAAHLVSRTVFFAGCFALGGREHPLSIKGVSWKNIRWGVRSSLAVGVLGFVVVTYNAVDLVMLSRLTNLSDVAFYSAAQRFTWPLLMTLSAVGASFYPVLAYLRTPSPARFERTCQRAVDTTLVMGGLALSGMLCGAEFLMGLLGPDLLPGANALQVLALVYFLKAISLVIGPVLIIVGAQRYALIYMSCGLVVKIAIIAVVAPRFGYLGVAFVSLGVESLFLVPVSLFFVKRFTGYAVHWSVGVRVLIIVGASVLVTRTLLPAGSLACALAAAVSYVGLAFATRIVHLSELRALLKREPA